MNPYRKLASVLVACAIPIGTVVGLSLTSPAWAKTHNKTVTGTGTVVCTPPTAKLTFDPPLTPTGTSAETAKLSKVKLGTCTANTGTVKEKVTATITGTTTNSCTAFATGTGKDSVTFTIKWTMPKETTTSVNFAAGTIGVNSTDSGFVASGGVATGSFATSSASFTADIGTGLSTLQNCIGGKGTVASVEISGGTGTF